MKIRNRTSIYCLGIFLSLSATAGPNRAAEAESKPVAVPPAGLPAAKETLEKYISAIGGRETFAKVDSQHAQGKLSIPAQGIEGQLDLFAARPNKLFLKVTAPGLGDILAGYNGKTAWTVNPATGPRILTGKEAEQMRDQANFEHALHNPDDFQVMETLEKTEFEGRPVYKLRLVRKGGFDSTNFFDAENGFLVGMIMKQESELGPISVVNVMKDYKRFGGLMHPTRLIQRMGGMEQIMIIHSVESGGVKESVFDLPAEIKALAK